MAVIPIINPIGRHPRHVIMRTFHVTARFFAFFAGRREMKKL